MQNEIDNYYNDIYKCQSKFVYNLCEELYKITKIKFYCNHDKKTILNLSILYFEEVIDNQPFIFEKYNYYDLICSNIVKNSHISDFFKNNFQTLTNKKFIIKYDTLNNRWTLLLCFTDDNFCYILVNFKILDELINFFYNNSYLLNTYKYAIVPYINLEDYYLKKNDNEMDHLKKNDNEMDHLKNKLDNLVINKKVIKNKIKK